MLAAVSVNPHVSIRSIEKLTTISKTSIHRFLQNNKFHPYKTSLVQHLKLSDSQRRLTFIASVAQFYESDNDIMNKIMWTDESRFNNNGIMNRHNFRYWSDKNPNWVSEVHHQIRWGTNVWCGILNGKIIGPYFYDGILNGQRYLDFLQNNLPSLLEDVPLNIRHTM